MKIVAHKDCIGESELQSLFDSVGVKYNAIDDALNNLAKDAANIREKENQSNDDEGKIMEMLKNLGKGFNLDDKNGMQNMEGMLGKWMNLLLKKEVLYEPIKVIRQKFPDWLKKNKKQLEEKGNGKDYNQYVKQFEVIKEIEGILEKEEPNMTVVLEKFNAMMEICSFPQDLLSEAFGHLGFNLDDFGGDMLSEMMGGAATTSNNDS
eukprot:UN23630